MKKQWIVMDGDRNSPLWDSILEQARMFASRKAAEKAALNETKTFPGIYFTVFEAVSLAVAEPKPAELRPVE